MRETPSLKVIYKDADFTIYIHDVKEDGSLLVMHAEVPPEITKSQQQKLRTIVEETFQILREKGIEEIEAWIETEEQAEFAIFYGFTEDIGELIIDGQHCFPPVYRFRKTL